MWKFSLLLFVVVTLQVKAGDLSRYETAILQHDIQASIQLKEAAQALKSSVDAICKNDASIEHAQQHWRNVARSWMVFQGREDMPLSVQPLVWQIQFWPDKKNTTGRKVQQLLSDDEALTPDVMAAFSVAGRGIGGLEWSLFDQDADWSSERHCVVAQAQAADLLSTVEVFQQGWLSPDWLTLSSEGRLAARFGALNDQLARVIKKLTLPLGKKGRANPYMAESWRAEYSLATLKASIEAMHQYWRVALESPVLAAGEGQTAESIDIVFRRLLDNWPEEESLKSLLAEPEGYRKVVGMKAQLAGIAEQLEVNVAPALGVTVGFNATDGD
ncbi:imelysin family protein [Thaumasiovibrio subtropicus]|uniref:imelysin family protein n=1 Tax=Thaumasiovibrio subtropicus TaxID=1891207 RepID=UPI000B3508EF|nr:imelysin family protein [Thaumasiovibrio subtropicus]